MKAILLAIAVASSILIATSLYNYSTSTSLYGEDVNTLFTKLVCIMQLVDWLLHRLTPSPAQMFCTSHQTLLKIPSLQQMLFCQCWLTGPLWFLIEFLLNVRAVNAYLPLWKCLYLSSHYL